MRILTNFLCVQSWFGHATSESINLPSWSVSTEMFLYLCCLPFLFRFLGKTPRYRLGTVASATIIGGACIGWCYTSGELHSAPRPLLRGIAGFTVGFILAGYLRGRNWTTPWATLSFTIGLSVCFVTLHPFFEFRGLCARTLLTCGVVLVCYGAFDNSAWVGRLSRIQPFPFLGAISYSLYLWHIPVQTLLRRATKSLVSDHSVVETRGFTLALMISVFAVSTASYFLFETPLRKWIRRFVMRAWVVRSETIDRERSASEIQRESNDPVKSPKGEIS